MKKISIIFLPLLFLPVLSYAEILSERLDDPAYFREVLREAYSKIERYKNENRHRLTLQNRPILPLRADQAQDYTILNMNLTILPEVKNNIDETRLTINDQILIKVTGMSPLDSAVFYSRTFSSITVYSPDTEIEYNVQPYPRDENISLIFITFKTPLPKDSIVRINITTSGRPNCDPSPFLGLITCQYDPLLTYDLSLLHPMRADGKDEAFSFDITIVVPDDYISTASGEFVGSIENGDGTKSELWRNPTAPSVAYGMAKFDRFSSTYIADESTIFNINSYVLPPRADVAKGFHDLVGRALAFYSDKFFRYQYPVISFNEIDNSSAAAYATPMAQFIPADLIERGAVDRGALSIFAHEVAHQWWGFMVMSKTSEYPWINEGFAEFSAMEFATKEDPAVRAFMYWAYAYLYFYMIQPEDDVPICSDDVFADEYRYILLTYYKGALLLAQLLNFMGEDFYKVLSHYVSKNLFQFSDVEKLKEVFKVVTGDDYSWYFNRWLYEAGYPIYTFKYDVRTIPDGRSSVDIYVNQVSSTYKVTQVNRPFDLPVDFAFYNEVGEEVERRTERIDKETFERSYQFDLPIQRVILDPGLKIYAKRVRSAQKGDINIDMEVDGRDLLLMAYSYGFNWYSYFEKEGARFLPNADLDMNGQVDDNDLNTVVENFGDCILSSCK